MQLPYVFQLLAAADQQRHGFLELHGIKAKQEVKLMAQAGLVEATLDDGKEGSFTSINRVSAMGRTFLGAFKNRPILDEATLAQSNAAVMAKWKVKLDLDLL